MELPRQAWLFVRGAESVRMTRLPMGSSLVVCGPGTTEHSHHFDADATLDEFRRWYEQRLIAEGWVLHESSDRRAGRRGGPPAQERRRRPPNAPTPER